MEILFTLNSMEFPHGVKWAKNHQESFYSNPNLIPVLITNTFQKAK